jgi:hypothetical protein
MQELQAMKIEVDAATATAKESRAATSSCSPSMLQAMKIEVDAAQTIASASLAAISSC